jgi:transposase
LPEEYGTWRTIYGLYDKWNGDGTLDATLDATLGRLRTAHIDDEAIDNDLRCIDGTDAPQAVEKSNPDEQADHALGRSRGGFSTKIHLLVDGFGPPLTLVITAVKLTKRLQSKQSCANQTHAYLMGTALRLHGH